MRSCLKGDELTQMGCFLKIYPQHTACLTGKNDNHNIQIDTQIKTSAMMGNDAACGLALRSEFRGNVCMCVCESH